MKVIVACSSCMGRFGLCLGACSLVNELIEIEIDLHPWGYTLVRMFRQPVKETCVVGDAGRYDLLLCFGIRCFASEK
jgi:hypothetical protein